MSEITVAWPLVIGPRLMPAVMFGQGTDTYGTVSVEIDHYDGERYVMRYVIDTGGGAYEAADIRSAVCMPDDGDLSLLVRHMTGALLAYLEDEAERYEAFMRSGEPVPLSGWSFSESVAEWAYLNSDEIAVARDALDGGE
jgi:hypothetical protein